MRKSERNLLSIVTLVTVALLVTCNRCQAGILQSLRPLFLGATEESFLEVSKADHSYVHWEVYCCLQGQCG